MGEAAENGAAGETAAAKPRVFSVGQLTRSIRNNLVANNPKLKGVWIEGEISGFKTYASGSSYFALKDAEAQINCVLFGHARARCAPEFIADVRDRGDAAANGQKVLAAGELELNMSRGTYSLKVAGLKKAGRGEKMAELLERKKAIEERGWNKLEHPELRRALPFLPQRIGVVTSAQGEVIKDICRVLGRRFENLEVALYPVKVQGSAAAGEIARGVKYFAESGWRPDLLIVGRGGGSMEDLWPFNEMAVLEAVAASPVPVISAVGHEGDVTLCDYVADVRAGTPSMAAELAVPVKAELERKVRELLGRMAAALTSAAEQRMLQTDNMAMRMERALALRVQRAEGRLRQAVLKLTPALRDRIAGAEKRISLLQQGMANAAGKGLERAETGLREAETRLRLLNPYAVLERGYSITMDGEGRVVRSVKDVKPGMRLTTRLRDGEAASVAAEE